MNTFEPLLMSGNGSETLSDVISIDKSTGEFTLSSEGLYDFVIYIDLDAGNDPSQIALQLWYEASPGVWDGWSEITAETTGRFLGSKAILRVSSQASVTNPPMKFKPYILKDATTQCTYNYIYLSCTRRPPVVSVNS